ncbi:MAG: hypothetical protein ACOC5E_03520 [Acidobacteriota bacterium]
MSVQPRRNRSGACLLLSLLVLTVACGGEGTVSDTEPAPGASTMRHEPVYPGERGGAEPVRPVEVARVTSGDDGEPPFYRAGPQAIAPDGTVYLLDLATGEIRLFGPDGTPTGTLGGPGQGPGELSEVVTTLAVAADRLIAVDELNGRLSIWGLDGEFREVVPFPTHPEDNGRVAYLELWGLSDGSLAGLYSRPSAGRQVLAAVVADSGGRPVAELARMSSRQTRALVGGRAAPIPVVRPVPQLAVDHDDGIYFTGAEEYEVTAFDRSGARRWELQVDWGRDPLPAEEVDRALGASAEMLRAMGEAPEVDASSVENVPDRLPALGAIKVDGHGHLWVFPYVYWDPRDPASLPPMVPVDVYDSAGERLYAGRIPSRFALHVDQDPAWSVAWRDSVWGIETDLDTGEQSLVRHRLEEPF